MPSTLGNGHFGSVISYDTSQAHPSTEIALIRRRSESILVVTNSRLKDVESVIEEVRRIKQDAEALAAWHEQIKWVVNLVLVDSSLRGFLFAQLASLPSFVDARVSTKEGKFNKYGLLADVVNDGILLEYDLVLLKDNDMRIAGFPWNTFMDLKGDATISGPLHQSIDESMARFTGEMRQWYKLHEAKPWKEGRLPEFEDLDPFPSDFIEQAFVLFDATFAHWFFSKILDVDFLSQPSDWGPDFMWCQAAFDFFPEKTDACVIVPVIALHEDTRQFQLVDRESMMLPVHAFRRDQTKKDWLDRSQKWESLIGNNVDVRGVLDRCEDTFGSRDLVDCAEDTAVTSLDWRNEEPITNLSTRNPLYFLHISKTGGTSMDDFMTLVSEQLAREYHGFQHYDWSYIEEVGNPRSDVDVVTMLREPVSRATSLFHFSKTLEWSEGWAFRNQTLQAFLETRDENPWRGMDDGQGLVYWLSGTMDSGQDWIWTDGKDRQLLARLRADREALCLRAAARLHQTVWFGILEDLPRSLMLFEHSFGVTFGDDLAFPTQNKNPHSSPDSDIEDMMRKLYPMDTWLYDYSKLLFEARWDFAFGGSEVFVAPELPAFPWDDEMDALSDVKTA